MKTPVTTEPMVPTKKPVFELIDNQPDVNVQQSEYQRLLGYPANHLPDGRASELAEWARRWYAANGKPWVYARQTSRIEMSGEAVRIDGEPFASKQLHDQWIETRAHSALLVAVSAGRQCEIKARELWEEGKPDEYFFLETYGSAVVEHLVTTAGGRICAWAEPQGMAALPHCSPGYSGWNIADQVRLIELIRPPAPRDFPRELRVLDSGMLEPKKSLLAVFGITRHLEKAQRFAKWIPCENCSLNGCQYRRTPYRDALPQIEDVNRLQPDPQHAAHRAASIVPVPHLPPAYSVNSRALRKWSQERLELKYGEDGSVEARFRYEGTTCSNLGRPLEFDYHVRLGPPELGYPILHANCVPAPGDTGHTSMCEYLNNADVLMTSIASEKPLAGQPLNAVLTWKRSASPAGCYCDPGSRAHKWGLVFEVLHFALAHAADNQTDRRPPVSLIKSTHDKVV